MQPKVKVTKGPCCWKCAKYSGPNIKKGYKRRKSKFTRKYFSVMIDRIEV